MQEKSFLEEQNELLENFIFNDLYATFENGNRLTRIELDITPECNKNCEYCYLAKYKDQLYPVEIRNKQTILHNLEIYLDFLLSKNITVAQIQLFSGEIWGSDFGFQVFDILLDKHIEKITKSIIIPSNCSFINNEKEYSKINEYMIKFLLRQVRLGFSISYDGLIVENENRPFINQSVVSEEEYANKMFQLTDTHNIGFHPMIAAGTIEKQIENFNWWCKKCEEYHWDVLDKVMMLEVRNDDWTDEKIKNYLIWLNHVMEYTLKHNLNNDLTNMINFMLNEDINKIKHYIPFVLLHGENNISCNLVHHHTVRLGDLALIPCHRLSYEKLLYGKFKVENDVITGIEALNVNFAFQNYLLNNFGYLKCDTCIIHDICTGQCHGAAFESSKESFYPIESVCNLEKAKITFILLKLEALVRDTNFLNDDAIYKTQGVVKRVNKYLRILGQIRTTEEYKKWIAMAETILSKT